MRLIERTVPDAMVLDFTMPGMNGAEVAKSVRGRLPALPIVFASGFSESAAVEAVQDDRAPMLHKPLKIEQLQPALGANY